MEILGLAIVIVLLFLAITFAIRFFVNENPIDFRTKFTSKVYVSNGIDVFLDTTAEKCFQRDMTELLQNCAESRSIICEDSKDSCEYVESTAESIFSSTLGKWNRKYEFRAYIKDNYNSPLVRVGEPCRGEKEQGLFPVPSSIGTIYVDLNTCL